MSAQPRILLGQLASFGDCLLATPIARQIKADYPGCTLTWAIGSMYRSAIDENPFVDAVWEVPLVRRDDMDDVWRRFAVEAKQRLAKGEFDRIFLTQVNPDNYQNFDGTVRASLLRGYPHPITVPIMPVLKLREQEVERVRRFADEERLREWKHVILFECASRSGQSYVTPSYAVRVAEYVRARVEGACLILSSNERLDNLPAGIIDGSVLALRENAELSKYCTLLVGCSSGITWLCTSDWAKPLPTIQVLKGSTSVYASMAHDAAYFGLPRDHIIEMADASVEHLGECITGALTKPFAVVRQEFHEEIPVELNLYLEAFMQSVIRRGQLIKLLKSLTITLGRYGFGPFARYIVSKLKQSPA
jgi:ADP-heptose:LPS heptosyltransferase